MLRVLLPFGMIGFTALLAVCAVEWLPQTLHYPELAFEAPGGLELRFLKHGRRAEDCERTLVELRDAVGKNCPTCVRESRCVKGLDAGRQVLLSHRPLNHASARLPDGVVTFDSPVVGLALLSCRQSEAATASRPGHLRARCYEAGNWR